MKIVLSTLDVLQNDKMIDWKKKKSFVLCVRTLWVHWLAILLQILENADSHAAINTAMEKKLQYVV